ncbi:hypothetical protein B0H11DRAFT_2233206 [Mycena galericulata]|nr:hypothetical protein B0H11DRAFT_2233206 [Mycena galericulata]
MASVVPATRLPSSGPTPSKKTAVMLSGLDLNSPTKPKPGAKIDDARRSPSPESEDDNMEELRKKFFGDITLPESTLETPRRLAALSDGRSRES